MAETPPRSIAAVLGAPDSKMFCDNARSFENHAYAKHCRDVLKQTDVTTFRPWDELELKAERRVDLIAIVRIAVSPAPLGAALHGGKDALVKTILAHPMPAFVYFEKPKERTAAKNDYGWDGTGYMTEKQRNEAADAANAEKRATVSRRAIFRPFSSLLEGTSRGVAAAATWIVRGDGSRRRRSRHADVPWRQIAATPRPRRGSSADGPRPRRE